MVAMAMVMAMVKRKNSFVVIVFSVTYWVSMSVVAEWTIIPSVSFQQLYTDNIDLSENNEQDEWVSEIRPSLTIRGKTPRLQTNLDYRLRQLFFMNNTDRSGTSHQLQSNARLEAIKRYFFIQAGIARRQQTISVDENFTDDNLVLGNNSSDVTTFQIEPQWFYNFASVANLSLSYNYNQVDSSRTKDNSTGKNWQFQLMAGPKFRRFPWRLNYSHNTINTIIEDAPGKRTFESIVGEVQYVLSRKYSLVASYGQETNRFESSFRNLDGNVWNAGMIWTPNPRLSLDARYGERFGEANYFLNFNYRRRQSVWKASYQQITTSSRQQILNQQLVILVDEFGHPITDPDTGNVLGFFIDTVDLVDEVFVSDKFQASVDWNTRKNRYRFSMTYTKRTFQIRATEDKTWFYNANWRHLFSQRLSSNIRLTWRQDDDNDLWLLGVNLSNKISNNLKMSLEYIHNIRRADQNSNVNEYDEHRVIAQITMDF